jgi:PAS domain S-box-containing protein
MKTGGVLFSFPNSRRAALVIVLILLVGIGCVSYIWARRFSEQQAEVAHTYQVLNELNSLSANLNAGSNAGRGYAVTGDRTMVASIDDLERSALADLEYLRALTVDNLPEQERLSELKPLVLDQIAIWRQSIALKDRDPGANEQQLDFLRAGRERAAQITLLLSAMRDDEVQLLNRRRDMSAQVQRRFTVVLVLTYLLAAGILVALFFVMASEVTRRTEAEALAKENEERLRMLVSGVQDYAIIRLDLEGRITTWNRGGERLFGYKDREIVGKPLQQLFNECDRDTPARHLSTAMSTGHVQDECQQVQQDGTKFWSTVDLTLLKSADGQPRGYALITRDITERRRQQKEIEERNAQINAFFSNAPVGLAIIDKDLRFQRINEPFSRLNGLSPEENRGSHVRDITSELGVELESLIRQVADSGVPILNHEIKGHAPANPTTLGWWLKSFFPISREDGTVTQIGAIVQDVTALKKAENTVRWLSGRLLQSRDDERRRLARDLHDSLGQLLTAVKMNLSYLGRDTVHLDERGRNAVVESKEIIDTCIKETRTLSHLLHPPMLDEVGLLPAIRWFVNGFSQRSGIGVQLDLPPTLQRLPVELEIAIFRAVQESLTNVHRHSGSPTASVRLAAEDSEILLEVSDDGCGIPPQKLAARQEQAMIGIGILGMRERMRQLGGQMEISSANKGTSVYVKLPLKEVA